MASTVVESASVTLEAQSPYKVYSDGLAQAELFDKLNLEVKGIKTHYARDWRRKYGKKFGKKEVSTR